MFYFIISHFRYEMHLKKKKNNGWETACQLLCSDITN